MPANFMAVVPEGILMESGCAEGMGVVPGERGVGMAEVDGTGAGKGAVDAGVERTPRMS